MKNIDVDLILHLALTQYLLVVFCFAQAIKVTVLLNILLVVSSFVYGGVYWAMMPAQAVLRPVFFDYGMRGIMRVQKPPTASVDLMAIHTQWSGTDLVNIPQHKVLKDRELVAEQYYAIGIELELPQSSANEVTSLDKHAQMYSRRYATCCCYNC
jgi:Putative adipose-regulatory protein (Seipin)